MPRSGERDYAVVQSKNGERPIACTTEAIRREVSLLSEVGERRQTHLVERVKIMLSDAAIPPGVCWID